MADTSITREERYLEYLTGDRKGNVPKPVTRRERYLYELCLKGMGGEISPEEIKNAVNEYLEKNPVKPGATTEQAQQIEQNKTDIASLKTETDSLKEDISTKITKFYASSQGKTHLADSDNGKIMDMMVYGKSEQKQYSGKNLLNPTLGTTTQNGVICTANGDGTYTIKGTNNSSNELIFSLIVADDEKKIFYNSLIGKKVKFIVESGSTISNSLGRICFCFYNKTENKFFKETYNGGNITVPTGYDFAFVDIHVNAGQTIPETILKPMITTDLTATYDDFEPYTGGIPSPNPDYPQEIKSVVNPTVKIVGKNLLNATLQTITQNGVTCTNNGDGTYALNGSNANIPSVFTLGTVYLIKDKKYKMAGCPANPGKAYLQLRTPKPDNVAYKNDYSSGVEFVIPKSGEYIVRIYYDVETYNNLLFKPMITTDLTATYDDFEPYHEQTVTLPYTLNAIPANSGGNVTIGGQQYIADYVDVERGKLVKKIKEISKDPIVLVSATNNPSKKRFVLGDKFLKAADNYNRWSCKCSNLQTLGVSMSASYGCIESCGISTDGVLYVYYEETSGFTTAEEFKAWWEKRDIQLMGILETPTEADLTPEEVQAFKALATYYPTTNISVNSEQLDGYTVFNYPIPFEDEWIKTKKDVDSLKVRLNDIVGYDNAAAHNAIYRGKNLGTQFTAEMSANIKNGTFKDLYCGDYLVINGTTYRFMDLNYLFKTGDTSLEINHILVVPDAPMYNHVMNDTNTTEGGYVGSKMYTSGLDQALAKIKADFGEAHIVTYRNLLVNAASNGIPSSWAWYSRQIDLMNEEMVYGTRAWSQATQNGYDTGSNKSQLAAFKHNHSLISSCRSWYWLRAVRSSTDFCLVGGDGGAFNHSASYASGVRPCFLIS